MYLHVSCKNVCNDCILLVDSYDIDDSIAWIISFIVVVVASTLLVNKI